MSPVSLANAAITQNICDISPRSLWRPGGNPPCRWAVHLLPTDTGASCPGARTLGARTPGTQTLGARTLGARTLGELRPGAPMPTPPAGSGTSPLPGTVALVGAQRSARGSLSNFSRILDCYPQRQLFKAAVSFP